MVLTDSPVWPIRSEETLSWEISQLHYCDPRQFRIWKIVMEWCTSFGTRLGVQVPDFSACFGYFTKWDRTTLWYLEITSSLFFNYSWNKIIEDISWPGRDTKFLFECWKTFHEWALLSNCFMMNLKLQNAAQRHFVFVECYVVKLLSCVAWLSRTFSTFLDYSWIIN